MSSFTRLLMALVPPFRKRFAEVAGKEVENIHMAAHQRNMGKAFS